MERRAFTPMWPHASTISTISSSIADQIESNTCPICFELMKSPDFSPILLSPCGHTFCAKCVARHISIHEKKARFDGRMGPAPCPYCRRRISSQTLNISLQNMITNILSLQQTLERADDHKVGFCNGFLQAQTRCHILQRELQDSTNIKQKMDKEILETEDALIQLQAKEKELEEKIQKVSLEHQNILTKVMDTKNKSTSLKRSREDVESKLSLVQASLFALEQERDKYKLLFQGDCLLGEEVH